MPSLSDITDRSSVVRALAEYDRIGQEEFLAKYGFRAARVCYLVHDGKRYDSKALLGAAYGFQFPAEGPLRPADFSGGDATVGRVLARLGFKVETDIEPVPLPDQRDGAGESEVGASSAPPDPAVVSSRTWIFQANPNVFDI